MSWIWVGALVGAVLGGAARTLVRPLLRGGDQPPVPAATGVALLTVVGALLGAGVAQLAAHGIVTAAAAAAMAVVGLLAAAVDVREFRLPDVLTYPLFVAGLLGALLLPLPAGAGWRSLLAALGYGGWMLWVALLVPDGYGLGDVKFAAGLGAWLGGLGVLPVASAVLYGQFLLVLTLLAGRLWGRRAGAAREVPLGPALLAGAALALLLA